MKKRLGLGKKKNKPVPASPRTSDDSATKNDIPKKPNGGGKKPKGPQPGLCTDIMAITVLWIVEVLHISDTYLKEGYIKDIFTHSEDIIIDRGRGGGIAWTIITVSLMLSIGALLTFSLPKITAVQNFIHKFKFWILLAGLSIYSFSAVIGIILSVTSHTEVVVLLSYLEMSWYAVHPIRYWYIFHQRFPISIQWSHIIVSGNIVVLWVVELIFTVQVKNALHPFSRMFYTIAYSIATVVSVGWVIGIYFIKGFLNRAPADVSSVREVYAQTEAIESFERRQKYISIKLFLALIGPAVIFPVMNAYIEVGCVKLLENAVFPAMNKVSYYRPDLLTALLVVVIVEGVLQGLKKFRNELFELAVIVAAHLINIIAIIMLMRILNITFEMRNRFPEKDAAILILCSDREEVYVLQIGYEFKQWHRGTTQLIVHNIADQRLIPIRFIQPETGKVVFEDKLNIQVSRNLSVNGYNFVKNSSGYHLLKYESFPPLRLGSNTARAIIISALEECTNYNKTAYDEVGYNENTTRGVRIRERCWPISLLFYREGTDVSKAVPFKPPANDELKHFGFVCDPRMPNVSDATRPCQAPSMILHRRHLKAYAILLQITFKIRTGERFNYINPQTIFIFRLEERKHVETPIINEYKCLDYRQEPESELVSSMIIYGVSLGFAWVAYIHFIWIQCPVRFRTFIIFSFFAAICAASSLTKNYLIKFNENAVFGLLLFATCCFLWQITATVLYVIRNRRYLKGEDQQPHQGWLRY